MRLSTILLSAGLLLSPQVLADEIEKAKKEMAAGAKDFVAGNCKSALVHFNAASNYAPEAAGPHRELGKTLECLEKYEEAQREYELYMQMKPDASDIEEVKGYLEDVKKKIVETPLTPSSQSTAAPPTESSPSPSIKTPRSSLTIKPSARLRSKTATPSPKESTTSASRRRASRP
jgi:hypothetical protein